MKILDIVAGACCAAGAIQLFISHEYGFAAACAVLTVTNLIDYAKRD